MRGICSIEGCDREIKGQKWCNVHYMRWYHHGSPHYSRDKYLEELAPQRFWAKVNKANSCWEWRGTFNDSGYGLFHAHGKRWRAHRYSWTMANGAIPEGMFIDHICRNRACVNPGHLRFASVKQNSENTTSRTGALSRYRGVTFDKKRNKWIAQVHHSLRNVYGGAFDSEEEAGIAARDLRNILFTHNHEDRIEDEENILR